MNPSRRIEEGRSNDFVTDSEEGGEKIPAVDVGADVADVAKDRRSGGRNATEYHERREGWRGSTDKYRSTRNYGDDEARLARRDEAWRNGGRRGDYRRNDSRRFDHRRDGYRRDDLCNRDEVQNGSNRRDDPRREDHRRYGQQADHYYRRRDDFNYRGGNDYRRGDTYRGRRDYGPDDRETKLCEPPRRHRPSLADDSIGDDGANTLDREKDEDQEQNIMEPERSEYTRVSERYESRNGRWNGQSNEGDDGSRPDFENRSRGEQTNEFHRGRYGERRDEGRSFRGERRFDRDDRRGCDDYKRDLREDSRLRDDNKRRRGNSRGAYGREPYDHVYYDRRSEESRRNRPDFRRGSNRFSRSYDKPRESKPDNEAPSVEEILIEDHENDRLESETKDPVGNHRNDVRVQAEEDGFCEESSRHNSADIDAATINQ